MTRVGGFSRGKLEAGRNELDFCRATLLKITTPLILRDLRRGVQVHSRGAAQLHWGVKQFSLGC